MIYFRVDSNSQIGSGHVMRSIALAQAFRKVGHEIVFLTADDNPILMLRDKNFRCVVLDSVWNDLSREIDKVRDILRRDARSILIIDTYQITREYVEALTPYSLVCYLGSKQEYLGNIDAVINYSTSINHEFYERNYGAQNTRLILGFRYAPLREEFQDIPLRINEQVQRVLINTGSTDPIGWTEQLLPLLLTMEEMSGIELHVIVGSMFKNRDELHRIYDPVANVRLHENVSNMAVLMREMDLALSANGTTVWELAAVGVPTISFSMVPEQETNAIHMGRLRLVDYCGAAYPDINRCLTEVLSRTKKYVADYEARKNLIVKAREIIDGKGAFRIEAEVVKMLEESEARNGS